MSEMERTKAVRFRGTKEKILSFFPDFTGDFYELNAYLCEIQNIDAWDTKPGQFKASYGVCYGKENGSSDWDIEYYLDYILDYEWDSPSSEFERTRRLSLDEILKYGKLFQKFCISTFDVYDGNQLRLVEYCYYNGSDAPAVYDQEDKFYEEV